VVLPLLPFIFAWSFLAELFLQSRQPPAPVQAAVRRTSDVIDLAAFRQSRNNESIK